MSDASPSLHHAATTSLAVERLLWATRPMGLLALTFWVLHPATAQNGDTIHLALLGFLAGIAYGVVVYGRKLQDYITQSNQSQRFKANRVPEEYYWGNVVQTMFDNR